MLVRSLRIWVFLATLVAALHVPGGTVPVYRLWNQRDDSNHRYATSAAIKDEMLAAGYVSEGYGPDGVVMCAVQ